MEKTSHYRYLFIVNPKAGKGKFRKLIPYIKNEFPKEIQYDIVISQFPGEARDMIRKRFDEYDVFVAAGGDGTVNEVSGELINTDKLLGIIAIGSGNGMAREMGIYINYRRALKKLQKARTRMIDTVQINSRTFINMAGVGFDAHIARGFEGSGKRGITPYAKLVLRSVFKYEPVEYEIYINEQRLTRLAYMVSIANTTQFGGGAHICPLAKPDDGIAHIVILHPFNYFKAPFMAYRLFTGSIHKSKAIEVLSGQSFSIKGHNLITHIDGEPVDLGDDLSIRVIPKSISVIC